MTRLLVVEAAGNLWGSEKALLDLLDGLSGVDVGVCCPPGTPLEPELARRNFQVFPTFVSELHKKSRWHRMWAALGLLRACLVWKPDVIYLNQSGAYRIAAVAARLMNLPVVAHVRIFEDVEYLARQNPRPSRLKGLIAISRTIEGAIRAKPSLRAIPCHMLYDAYRREIPPALAIDRNTELACVGRIFLIKGQDILVDALQLLEAKGRPVPCLMAGEGDPAYVGALRARAPASITWLGRVADIVPLLRRCQVSVCPSRAEPLGRVIFEAWDAGTLPITCAQSGGAAEVIGASGGGLLYAENTAEDLAGAITQALSLDVGERGDMVRHGQQWLESECDPVRYGAAVSAIFKSVITGTRI